MELKLGTKLNLNNEICYKSSKESMSDRKLTGEYYIWNENILNNRVRITDNFANCGEKGKSIGWIDVNSIGNSRESDVEEDDNNSKKVLLNKSVEANMSAHISRELLGTEVISRRNSLMAICYKYFGDYKYIQNIKEDNNLMTTIVPIGTEIKIYNYKE